MLLFSLFNCFLFLTSHDGIMRGKAPTKKGVKSKEVAIRVFRDVINFLKK